MQLHEKIFFFASLEVEINSFDSLRLFECANAFQVQEGDLVLPLLMERRNKKLSRS